MKSKIIKQLREAERLAFLKLDPVDRVLTMESVLYEVIYAKAAEEGVADSEIYKRYLARDKKRRRAV